MTAPALDLTEKVALVVLRKWLLTLVAPGVEVVRGEGNRVPEPKGADFLVLTPILRERIETNTDTYSDEYPSAPGVKTILAPTRLTVQIDIHGPASGDTVQLISTLFRDEAAVAAFAVLDPRVAPLFTSEPRQAPFMNGEQQMEYRWTVDAVMQVNQSVTVPQDFADEIVTTPVETDAAYPPEGTK